MRCIQFEKCKDGYSDTTVELDNRELQCIVNCMYICLEEQGHYSKDINYWELYLQFADILSFVNTGVHGNELVRKTVIDKIKDIKQEIK